MSDPAAAAHYVFDAYGTLFDHAAALRHKEVPAWQQLSQVWHKASRMHLDSRTEPASCDVLGPRATAPRRSGLGACGSTARGARDEYADLAPDPCAGRPHGIALDDQLEPWGRGRPRLA